MDSYHVIWGSINHKQLLFHEESLALSQDMPFNHYHCTQRYWCWNSDAAVCYDFDINILFAEEYYNISCKVIEQLLMQLLWKWHPKYILYGAKYDTVNNYSRNLDDCNADYLD